MAEKKTFTFTDEYGNTGDIKGPATASRKEAFRMFVKKVERDGLNWGAEADIAKPAGINLVQRAEQDIGLDPKAERLNLLPYPKGALKGQEGPVDWSNWVAPEIVAGSIKSAMLPGHAYQGGKYTTNEALEAAGGFVAPATTMGRLRAGKTKSQFIKNAPTSRELKSAAGKIVDSEKGRLDFISPDDHISWLAKVEAKAMDDGMDQDLHSDLWKGINAMSRRMGRDLDVKEAIILRRLLTKARMSRDGDERRLAGMVTDDFDDFVEAAFEGTKLKRFRKLWSNAKKSDMIEEAIEAGGQKASGVENGIRIEIRKILNSEKKSRGFTKDEIKALQKVADGSPLTNLMRLAGKFAPVKKGGGSGALMASLGALGAYEATGMTGLGLAVPVAGMAGDRLAAALTKRAADFARALTATGGKSPALMSPLRPMAPYAGGALVGSQMNNSNQQPDQQPALMQGAVPPTVAARRNRRGFRTQ
jgi:hypothetical protein